MRRIATLLIYIVCGSFVHAQYNYGDMYGKKRADAFPAPLQYKMKGWYFSPGLTLMPPQTFSFVKDIITNESEGPRSKMGAFLAIGRYKIFEYPGIFRYLDYGLAYKSLRGKEVNTGEKFGDHFVSGHFNLNNSIHINKYSFIQNTLGINADYAILRFNTGDSPSAFITSLHYKFGFGYKVNKKLMIIPSIETPILNILPFEQGRSSMAYLSSRYRPMIISLRFLLLKEKFDECPYVPPPPGGLPTEGGANDGGME